MHGGIFGREPELAAIAHLVDDVAQGPAVAALWGEAGIGKTTVWNAGVESARRLGWVTLECRPAASEIRLSYAGLADLLAGTGSEVFTPLPRPQRRALDAALLRGGDDDPAPDPRAAATGLVSVLEHLSGTAPVLVAIDDIQWLDDPSRRVVEFAVRRCAGPVAVLTARRIEAHAAPADELVPRDPVRQRLVRVGPLSLGALHHVIRQQIGRALPRHVLVRVAERSAGNPFFALELARALDAGATSTTVLPRSLRSLVVHRLAALPPPVHEALLVVSSAVEPRVDLVEAVLEGAGAVELLGHAEDAGVVELSGGVARFTHPLLATGVYSEASPTTRRALHRRLSGLVDDVEERARHLALAAVGPDAGTVAALEAAATHARRRGAPSAAAELLELAMDLGVDDPGVQVRAAYDHFHANDPSRARDLLESAITALGPVPLRAEALLLLATIRFDVDGDAAGVALLERAIDEARGDPRLRCSIALELGYQVFSTCGPKAGYRYASAAVEEAERIGDEGLLAEALAERTFNRFVLGEGVDEQALDRALALEDPDRRSRMNIWPTFLAAFIRQRSDHLDDARVGFATARQRCLDQGRDGELWFVSYPAIGAACQAGDLEIAERSVDELVEHADLLGTDQARALARTFQAQLWGWIGRVDEAREAAEEAVALFGPVTQTTFPRYPVTILGATELSVGDHERAAGWLVPAINRSIAVGFREPAFLPSMADAAEALIGLGRRGEAAPLVESLEASGRRPSGHWARAVGFRCRALLLAAERQADDAFEAFDRALAAHDEVPQLRYDRARTLLALGQFQRRRNRRLAAQASLHDAARLFDQVGTRQWLRNARDELDRLGLHPGPGDELTATEQHIAELAASGRTNREVATALFVSPKTVEAHLGRVYRKLGIHSRAELGQLMAARTNPSLPAGKHRETPDAFPAPTPPSSGC